MSWFGCPQTPGHFWDMLDVCRALLKGFERYVDFHWDARKVLYDSTKATKKLKLDFSILLLSLTNTKCCFFSRFSVSCVLGWFLQPSHTSTGQCHFGTAWTIPKMIWHDPFLRWKTCKGLTFSGIKSSCGCCCRGWWIVELHLCWWLLLGVYTHKPHLNGWIRTHSTVTWHSCCPVSVLVR